MRTWTFEECRPPGDGPWTGEPDKAQWVDEPTGLDCLIVRAHTGALCGYVGLPPGHPWHGKAWTEEPAIGDLCVHGGVNYSAPCVEGGEEQPVYRTFDYVRDQVTHLASQVSAVTVGVR